MITAWVTSVEFAPTHSEKPGPVFHLSSQKVCLSAHDIWFGTWRSNEMGNTACLLVVTTISVAMHQMSRDLNPSRVFWIAKV
jgi:hypothetical protein